MRETVNLIQDLTLAVSERLEVGLKPAEKRGVDHISVLWAAEWPAFRCFLLRPHLPISGR
jgi:hypothetical protein